MPVDSWRGKLLDGAAVLLNIGTKDLIFAYSENVEMENFGEDRHGNVKLRCRLDRLHCYGVMTSIELGKYAKWRKACHDDEVNRSSEAAVRSPSASGKLRCANCGQEYSLADYRPDAEAIRCSGCKEVLPR
jgi:hypothetical protein